MLPLGLICYKVCPKVASHRVVCPTSIDFKHHIGSILVPLGLICYKICPKEASHRVVCPTSIDFKHHIASILVPLGLICYKVCPKVASHRVVCPTSISCKHMLPVLRFSSRDRGNEAVTNKLSSVREAVGGRSPPVVSAARMKCAVFASVKHT